MGHKSQRCHNWMEPDAEFNITASRRNISSQWMTLTVNKIFLTTICHVFFKNVSCLSGVDYFSKRRIRDHVNRCSKSIHNGWDHSGENRCFSWKLALSTMICTFNVYYVLFRRLREIWGNLISLDPWQKQPPLCR